MQNEAAVELDSEEQASLNLRVLLVDDDLTSRFLLSEIMSGLGYDFEVAVNGSDALHKLDSSGHFDLVITDCQMPIMDGFEAVKRIRGMKKDYAGIKIVCMSSKHLPDEALPVECKNCDVDCFLRKPVSITAVEKLLDEATRDA